MRVRMLTYSIFGTDGEVDVPDDMGQGLIRGGHATGAGAIVRSPAPGPAPAVVSGPAATAAGPDLETIVRAGTATAEAAAAIPDPEPEPDPVSPPSPADPKADWAAYAVSRAKTPAEAEAARNMTKADLMSRYGGRL